MARQKNTGNRIRNREKIDQALELRKAGASFKAIGEALGGITKQAAFKLVEAGLQELNAQCAAGAEELRRLELERLDGMELALWKQRSNPRVADTLLRIAERRAKLLGLDAPGKLAMTDPDGEAALVPCVVQVVLVRPQEA